MNLWVARCLRYLWNKKKWMLLNSKVVWRRTKDHVSKPSTWNQMHGHIYHFYLLYSKVNYDLSRTKNDTFSRINLMWNWVVSQSSKRLQMNVVIESVVVIVKMNVSRTYIGLPLSCVGRELTNAKIDQWDQINMYLWKGVTILK